MDVLHALWLPGSGLALWSEDATLTMTSRSQALRVARPHPLAVAAASLCAVFGGEPSHLILALPSLAKSPCDSTDLVRSRPRPHADTAPRLRAWTVPVTVLPPGDALRFLTADPEENSFDARPGESIAYYRALASFVVDLVGRGAVVPMITEGRDEGYEARWRPLLQGPDVSFVASAVTAMPPVCRAVVPGVDDLVGLDPADLVADVVLGLTDAAIRALWPSSAGTLTDQLPRTRARPSAQDRALMAWLRALTGNPVVDAPAADIARVKHMLEPWDDVGIAAACPAYLVMRLHEPSDSPGEDGAATTLESEASWRVDFALQSVADPSLIVPAAQIWQGTSGLERWFDNPDQMLLAELARASAVYAPVATALRQPAPAELALTDQEAYDFLTKAAETLSNIGVVVHLPGWWANRARVGLNAHATPGEPGGISEGMLTAETLYNCSWRMMLGDDSLTDDEMAALVQAKVPLVQMRGQWVAFDPERVRRGLDFIRARRETDDRRTAAEIVALALGPQAGDLPEEILSVTAGGTLGEFLDGTLADSMRPADPPPWFAATLRPYQQRGLAWLSFLGRLGLGACLADDMGLGKTVQLLALEAVEKDDAIGQPMQRAGVRSGTRRAAPAGHPGSAPRRPTLVVCPVSMVGAWQREAARFAPALRVVVHHGAERRHGEDFASQANQADLVVTTYQVLLRDVADLAALDWGRVVVDEAQNVKNAATQSAKAAGRLRAHQRVALTGTPVENKLAELRSILDFCNPGFLGSPEVFRARFANPIERAGDAAVAEQLRALTRPFILRRLKTDKTVIDDLPDKIDTKQVCFLLPEQASLYQAVVTDMMARIERASGIERRGLVLATLTKLKQVCNHPAQFLHDGSPIGRRSGKIARLDDIVAEILAEDGKALIFTQYTEFGDLLVRHLGTRFGRPVAYLHGQVPKRRRDELVAEFQSEAGPPLFVLSLRAGGTGLTLTAANHVLHVDRWWNPAVENQATDRAFRIGQRRSVQVHTFVTAGTLEERIDTMIEQKKALAELVVGDGEGWLTELSTAELRDVFALSKEAFGE